MDFEKVCMMFTMQEPYYGILLSSMERRENNRIPTMGVGRSGNVFVLHFNRQFVESLPIETALQALKHETLHVAFNHFSLWDDDKPTKEIQKVRNIAADLEVNSYIDRQALDEKNNREWMFADKFGWENEAGTREYYSRLMQMAQQQQNQNQQQQSGQQGQSGVGGSGGSQEVPQEFLDQLNEQDDHSMWPQMDEAEQEQMQQVIDDMLEFAADEVEKSCGKIPGEMVGKINAIRNKKKPKPVADWKRYFRRYLGNEFTEFIRKSKKHESRRFPDAAGNRHRRKSHILVAIDTSGSVSMPEYLEFFGQIKTLTQHADFHIVECDTTIRYEYDYRGHPNETLHGHGGTDFQKPIDLFLANRRKYDALVYFTDGYCGIPKNTPKETLWVISSKGDQTDRNKYKVNGASVAFIPKKQ